GAAGASTRPSAAPAVAPAATASANAHQYGTTRCPIWTSSTTFHRSAASRTHSAAHDAPRRPAAARARARAAAPSAGSAYRVVERTFTAKTGVSGWPVEGAAAQMSSATAEIADAM